MRQTRTSRALAKLVALAVIVTLCLPAASGAAAERGRDGAFRQEPVPPVRGDVVTGDTPASPPRLGNGRATWQAAAPATGLGFDAIENTDNGELTWPGDPTGAIGDSYFLTAVNTSYALYDLTGNLEIGPDPLEDLFRLPRGAEVFDPKVVYDHYRNHFVLVFMAVKEARQRARQRSYLLILTIPDATAADPSTWAGGRVLADRTRRDGKQFADYPGLGFSGDHVVVTANMFGFGNRRFQGATVFVFRKGRLYDPERSLRFQTFLGSQTENPGGTSAFTIQPAVTVGPGRFLFMTSFDPGRPSFLVLWRLGERNGRLQLARTAIRVPRGRIAPFGTQNGGTVDRANTWWDPGDLRFVSTFADLSASPGSVYTAHAIARNIRRDTNTGGYIEAAVRWYEVRPKGALKRSSTERVGTIGKAETDAGWPALATDEAGNLFVTYSRASAVTNEFLSAWVAQVEPGTTRDTSTLLEPGTARMEAIPGPERWGDYNAMSRDPMDGSLVSTVNQYAKSDGSGPTKNWQQTVHIVQHG